jgi:hypothetical protein
MFAYVAIPLTCWMCALVAIPRRPRRGNEVEEFVYARLLGRSQRVALLALVVTAVAFFTFVLALPDRVDPNFSHTPSMHQVCDDQPIEQRACQWE